MKGSKWIFFFAMIVITCTVVVTGHGQDRFTVIGAIDARDIINQKATSLPKPEYPEALKGTGERALVRIRVEVDESGNVMSATPEISEEKAYRVNETTGEREAYTPDPPNPLLVEAARVAALEAKFKPETRDGQPVGYSGVVVYSIFEKLEPPPAPAVRRPPDQISGGVLNSKAISLPRPTYPAVPEAVRASGPVTVQVLIDEEGNVISANAVSGHPLLRAAAVQAAREAKFAPTRLSGQPVKVSGVITYNFVAP